jgi:hypothetical protein
MSWRNYRKAEDGPAYMLWPEGKRHLTAQEAALAEGQPPLDNNAPCRCKRPEPLGSRCFSCQRLIDPSREAAKRAVEDARAEAVKHVHVSAIEITLAEFAGARRDPLSKLRQWLNEYECEPLNFLLSDADHRPLFISFTRGGQSLVEAVGRLRGKYQAWFHQVAFIGVKAFFHGFAIDIHNAMVIDRRSVTPRANSVHNFDRLRGDKPSALAEQCGSCGAIWRLQWREKAGQEQPPSKVLFAQPPSHAWANLADVNPAPIRLGASEPSRWECVCLNCRVLRQAQDEGEKGTSIGRCPVCEKDGPLQGHHFYLANLRQLGAPEDVVPLCCNCHGRTHDLWISAHTRANETGQPIDHEHVSRMARGRCDPAIWDGRDPYTWLHWELGLPGRRSQAAAVLPPPRARTAASATSGRRIGANGDRRGSAKARKPLPSP